MGEAENLAGSVCDPLSRVFVSEPCQKLIENLLDCLKVPEEGTVMPLENDRSERGKMDLTYGKCLLPLLLTPVTFEDCQNDALRKAPVQGLLVIHQCQLQRAQEWWCRESASDHTTMGLFPGNVMHVPSVFCVIHIYIICQFIQHRCGGLHCVSHSSRKL